LGEHVGGLSVQEYDVTQYAASGKTATIAVEVDSKQRWAVDALFGASSLADYMDIEWGGIWGHVRLEARSDTWLSDLFVQPDVAGARCEARATLHGKPELAGTAKLEVFDNRGQRVAENLVEIDPKTSVGQSIAAKAAIPNPKLWTPDSPTLYTARLSLLKGSQVVDTVESRFGMRQFTVDGHRLLLNGKRLMLCGYGDDHIYPAWMSMPSDKALHLKQLRVIKSFGFNHVRHHSTIMPPEYYDACDEVGMITTAEFPICYAEFLPGMGKTWNARVAPGTDPGPATETYKREWDAVIKRHRNHPSILCWVMGNELWEGIPLRNDFQRIAHNNDPMRFFADTDGLFGIVNRDTLDLLFAMFNVGSNPLDNPAKFKTPTPPKPVISHESGNYVTFSRPDLVDQFQHNIKPFWLTNGRAKLEQLGLLQEADRWAEKSERLYTLLHKHNIETLRKNPCISGYHWWLFQDYWTSSNGIVDHYFRPKSITKEEVLKFNNAVVLLQDGLDRTYRGGTTLAMKLLVSNFSSDALQGQLSWRVTAGDQTIDEQRMPSPPVPQGDLAEAAHLNIALPDVAVPTKVRIAAKLDTGSKTVDNAWTTWLYPNQARPSESSVPIFVDAAQIDRWKTWNVKPIPAEGDLPANAVYVIRWPCDPRIVDALDRGAGVIALEGASPFCKSYPVTFRTSWWKAGDTSQTNHTGTFVYDHPTTRAMAPDGWCDDAWFFLIDGGVKYDLEKSPMRPDVMIRALPSMARVEDEALLFEVGVGKGCLMVSGLNHRAAQGRPENEWIVTKLIEHAVTFPKPRAHWPASFLAVVEAAPAGCLPGFRRLVSNQGETASWYSYREDNATAFVCRQDAVGHAVAWETPPVKATQQGDRATIVFAGGLGYSSEPKSAGFALDINGREAVRFDLPEPHEWQSDDQRITLKFTARRTISVDQFGQFALTVPRNMLKAGEPCRLTVRSLGTGSRRWFALYPYMDVR